MVKVYATGRMTRYLASLQAGATIQASARPEPTITDVSKLSKGVLMVAGGSAVTVALQICAAALRYGGPRGGPPVRLVLCNHSVEDVLFRVRFDAMLKCCPAFTLVHCISGPVKTLPP